MRLGNKTNYKSEQEAIKKNLQKVMPPEWKCACGRSNSPARIICPRCQAEKKEERK